LVGLCKELAALPAAARREAYLSLSDGTRAAIKALDYEWALLARPEQLAPEPPWRWWMMAGGRGGGKTRAASEQVIEWAHEHPGCRMAFISKDAGGYRRIQLLGMSGILRRSPPWFKPTWRKTDKLVVWPNDAIAELHSSEEPGTLRGPEYHFAWLTELFHWQIPRGETEPTAWREGIKMSLRLALPGSPPRGIIDSSPRSTDFCANLLLGKPDARGDRPVSQEQIDSGEWRIVHELVDQDGERHEYVLVVRRWSSERNAENLAPGAIAEWRHDLAGSPIEEQELDGRILTKVKGALFSHENFDAFEVRVVPRLVRTLVAVDPTRSDAPRDEAGILVGGLGADGDVYVWDDCTVKGRPDAWGRAAIGARNRYGADGIVREVNRLPDSLKAVIRRLDPKVKWFDVHATEGKRSRAEPVSAEYERGRVHHVRDRRDPRRLALLEAEMVGWDPRTSRVSPNRMDALVWLVTSLLNLGGTERAPIRMY
jgi:phage terminase large subunit-like protein